MDKWGDDMATAKDYLGQAEQELSGQYNSKMEQLKSNLASQLANYETSKGTINQNYDKQVDNQNLQNTLSENNFSNTMLGRGFGRSSMVTTGLAGMDDKNTRLVGNINANRTSELNNVNNQITNANNTYASSLKSLNDEKGAAIQQLARQLEAQAWERAYQERQLELQRQQVEAQKQRYSSGYGSGSSSNPSISAGSNYDSALRVLDEINSSYAGSPLQQMQYLQNLAGEFQNDTTKNGKYIKGLIQQAYDSASKKAQALSKNGNYYSKVSDNYNSKIHPVGNYDPQSSGTIYTSNEPVQSAQSSSKKTKPGIQNVLEANTKNLFPLMQLLANKLPKLP
jgi:DNA repair exonuclease SbcCD ATPase subunit